jgi:hypothetical protein
MSSFCTSCGATYRGNSFCTSCGAAQSVVEPISAEPTAVATPKVLETSDAQLMSDGVNQEPQISGGTKTKNKTKLVLFAVAVIVFLGSSSGAYFLGKSSVDLETEKKISYDSGYSAGDSAGYSRGDSAGYSRGDADGYSRGFDAGETAGCEGVFSFSDGVWDHMVPWSPYYSRKQGGYYTSRSDC